MKCGLVTSGQDLELKAAGIRPTRQRAALLGLLRRGGNRHVAAEQLYREACQDGLHLSLATVYNALNLFVHAGIVRRVDVGERTWFCTNLSNHHHLYDEVAGELSDLPADALALTGMPSLPDGAQLVRADIIVRFRRGKTRPDGV
ncbi:MAG: transcriptional repressor [Magnetospirillum sp.]|nr:transcriptional repressor [Magnetospirillum sp.]